ncbi:MAG: DUF2789 family protein [Shewanellaceae bacterium]|nr:DUF2789 family protein [Shewanellaceae bacterium]
METFKHDITHLFDQLGLPNASSDIETFIMNNRLKEGQHITEAKCWNESQIEFFKNEFDQDSEWCIAIDELTELMIETNTHNPLSRKGFFGKILKLFGR